MTTTFLWGLKRSGIHHVVNWLYANHGGVDKDDLDAADLHPQLHDGFRDPRAGVAFFNNCGQLYSRRQELGTVDREDFERARSHQPTTLFGIEDCQLSLVQRTALQPPATTVFLLRDPLNNLASRLEARERAPELFKVDRPYIELMATYCAEALGSTQHLDPKVLVIFDRFVTERTYRDAIAAALGVANVDSVSEVSDYGGGSSFTGTAPLASSTSVLTRYRERPIPSRLIGMLMEHESISDACDALFGYDLARVASAR